MEKTPYYSAIKDICNYLKDFGINTNNTSGDAWHVAPWKIYNKQSRRLNKELGIRGLNYMGNKNYKKTLTNI